ETSLEKTARAADQLTRRSQEAVHELEQAIGLRIASMDQRFRDAGSEAEGKLAAVRTSSDNELKRAQEVLAQVNSIASVVEDQSAKLVALTEITQQELERRATAMLEAHSQELGRRGEH